MTSGRQASAARRLLATGGLLIACGAVAACGTDGDPATVRVAAAASLTDLVDGIAEVLATGDGPLELRADVGGSATLASQIVEGSPADVFLSADEATMDRVVAADLVVGDVVTFATNHLAIAVPAGNPAGVTSLEDLADDGLLVGRCADEVPCGRLAQAELVESGIADRPDTEETDVRTLLRKVEAQELDAALVYATDLDATPAVERVADDRLDQTNRYQAARIAGGDTAAAERVLSVLLGEPGTALLAELGFGRP